MVRLPTKVGNIGGKRDLRQIVSSGPGIWVWRAFIQLEIPSVKLGIWVWSSEERFKPKRIWGHHQHTDNILKQFEPIWKNIQGQEKGSKTESWKTVIFQGMGSGKKQRKNYKRLKNKQNEVIEEFQWEIINNANTTEWVKKIKIKSILLDLAINATSVMNQINLCGGGQKPDCNRLRSEQEVKKWT